ncbi:PQQ-dependent sugar dehydrogenase [Nocardioides marmorisolisilvae]|uniref:PQQ-dependent sugar dehydrogenase n=1 Tax=Nocardioides marmorisolisilvae TaxID=1542737 RepID=A0A3N0DU66_9ACTN|nr:PQQ-dependent sugar dehydrogenase [Nocardioides marmorisolisilvae]RNL78943.1 PQQ-dependent sugar dehydrogenase [Nocardioides marmorisolisilvae]
MRRLGTVVLVSALVAVVPLASTPKVEAADQATTAFPSLTVTKLVGGLDIPWDVKELPGGRLLIGERTKKRLIVWHNSAKHVLNFPANIWASGETGLMGLAVDPNFSANRRIYTCQGGYTSNGGHDVRVVAWRMSAAYTSVEKVRTMVSGFPTSSGRHGGCRLLVDGNAIYVGTGDAAIGTNPQNKYSLGGKTLRMSRTTGAPYPGNPFISSSNHNARYVYTYGHRNVQGLARRYDGTIWSVEQGTDRDDEVNLLKRGGNYGYNPVPGYNESVPMTDFKLPGAQIGAKWSSGDPTLATSGGTFVSGAPWGDYRGMLAVAALKASRVVFLKFDGSGALVSTRTPSELESFGRLRSITVASNYDLLITTSNGSGGDYVLRVHPQN